MKYLFLTLTVCAAMMLAQAPTAPKAAPKAAPKTGTTGATKAKGPAKAAPNLLAPATLKATAPAVYVVRLDTTKGPVEIRVTRAWAPIGADRFYNLVRAGFFTDAAFFRTVKGFMAQFGVSARPEVNRVWENMNLRDDPVLQSNKRGFVAFAAGSAPNTRSTQLFIGMRDNSYLDSSGFAPIGEVIAGMEAVDMFYSGYADEPNADPGHMKGKAYLDQKYPKLDRILKAAILPPAPATPPVAK